jgi:RNA polymerase sigma factor (sigma-70 family)
MLDEGEIGARLGSLETRLRLLLLHLTGTALRARVEIDDLVQEVYLRALAEGTSLPGVSPREHELFCYLRVIARHTVIDVARAARASKRSAREIRLDRPSWSRTSLGGLDPQDPGPGPRTWMEGAEAQACLNQAFDRLSPEHRRVLGLRKFEGLSARDTAARMGSTEKAVHSMFRRALEAWDAALA